MPHARNWYGCLTGETAPRIVEYLNERLEGKVYTTVEQHEWFGYRLEVRTGQKLRGKIEAKPLPSELGYHLGLRWNDTYGVWCYSTSEATGRHFEGYHEERGTYRHPYFAFGQRDIKVATSNFHGHTIRVCITPEEWGGWEQLRSALGHLENLDGAYSRGDITSDHVVKGVRELMSYIKGDLED